MTHILGRSKSFGFARVATTTFWTKAKGVSKNLKKHLDSAQEAVQEGAQLVVFPELGISGYGCGDAFTQRFLQVLCLEALEKFCKKTAKLEAVFLLGLPLKVNQLFNVIAVVNEGKVIAFIPKSYIAGRDEWQENEWFAPAEDLQTSTVKLDWQNEPVPIGTDVLIDLMDTNGERAFTMGAEVCEDGWQTPSPGDRHAHNGAEVIANLSASNFVLGKNNWREVIFPANSGRQKSVYIYSTMAGDSTSRVTWDGHSFIIEDGSILGRSKRWPMPRDPNQVIVTDVDIQKISYDRQNDDGWRQAENKVRFPYRHVTASVQPWVPDISDIRRPLTRLPFIPKDPEAMKRVGDELFPALDQGVIGRLDHISEQQGGVPIDAFTGLSGGLDSCLAYLVGIDSYDRMGWDRKHYYAVRLPGPASSRKTQKNSLLLARALGTGLKTINITSETKRFLRKTGHEPCWDCLTCENAQARVRTLYLKTLGFNLGTGDMSEAAKGWCTEGGDQSSNFHVIANIPKTLVRYLVQYYIEYKADKKTQKILWSILGTLISPELRKPKPGEEIQSSEDKMGPYDLTDFFLYHMLRIGAEPERIAFLAEAAFSKVERKGDKVYDRAFILKWLRDWYIKFDFAQFKRNASPDSVLVGTIGLGAHDKLRWPSDGDPSDFVAEVDRLIAELT